MEGKELKRSANWPNTFKGVDRVFQQLGPSSFKSNYYGQSHSVAATPKAASSYGRRTTEAPHKYSKREGFLTDDVQAGEEDVLQHCGERSLHLPH